jgi:hypothetical protein
MGTTLLSTAPEHRSVVNASGSEIAEGKIVKLAANPTVPLEVDLASAVTDALYGVVVNAAIPNGEPGDAAIRGIVPVLAGGAVAAGDRVTTDANGDGVTATEGDVILGVAGTVGVDGALFEVELTGPGNDSLSTSVAAVAVNSAHVAGDGSDHADVATNTAAIAAIVDDHVRAEMTGLAAQTDEDEVSAALSGLVSKTFAPAEIAIVVTEATGSIAADGTINVGTTTDGAEILSAQALTGLDTAGKSRRIPLSEAQYDILANATLYANVESADSTATTLVLSVFVLGRQFAF